MYLTFDLPITANKRLTKGKRRDPKDGKIKTVFISTKKYREWKDTASLQIRSLLRPNGERFTNGERVRLTLKIHFANKIRRDIDNYVKGAQDVLTDCGVWADDTQVDELHVYRSEVAKPPYVEAYIDAI